MDCGKVRGVRYVSVHGGLCEGQNQGYSINFWKLAVLQQVGVK